MKRAAAAAAGLLALAGCVAETPSGRAAYAAHCTDCHGATGQGDGPLAALAGANGQLPDLSGLSERWGGSYPESYVVLAINGPSEVHRRVSAMPDFGPLLAGRPVVYTLPGGGTVETTNTVLALAAYLETLQR